MENTINDNANNKHYKDCIIEPFYLMLSVLSIEEFKGFLKGNIIKYAMRAPFKGQSEKDIEKYQYYKRLLDTIITYGEEYNLDREALENLVDEYKELHG